MEPMTLGSPVSSTSPTGSGGSGVLPEFLIGEIFSPHPVSPTKSPRPDHLTPRKHLSMQMTNNSPLSERRARTVQLNNGEKSGGPPIRGLFDTLESTNTITELPTTSLLMTAQSNISPNSMSSKRRASDENALVIDNWVTVFGFPPSTASSILTHFSQLGQLLDHKFPPKGNWVHLRYYSKIEARRALSFNGRILGGTTMIGVMPYRDAATLKGANDISTLPESPMSGIFAGQNRFASPALGDSPFGGDNSIRSPRVRPLNRSVHLDNEIFSPQNTPVRNSGLVSRTIDYIFRW